MQAPKKTVTVRDVKPSASAAIDSEPAVRTDQSAIAAGRKPLDSKCSDTVALKAKAVELYGIPHAGLRAIPAIDAGFKFAERFRSTAEFLAPGGLA
jgi:hypothetical protein